MATACVASGPYTLSGCVASVCTPPLDLTGYSMNETELSLAAGFTVTAACWDHYGSGGDLDWGGYLGCWDATHSFARCCVGTQASNATA